MAPRRDNQLNQARETKAHAAILDATHEVARTRGFDTTIAEIQVLSGTSTSTLYRHFPNGREELLARMIQELADESDREIPKLMEIEDGAERLMRWLYLGFDQVERYGQLAVQLAANTVPEPFREIIDVVALRRFIGRTIKDCQMQGHCRPGVDVRAAVRICFALMNPALVRECQEAGMTNTDIARQTMEVFASTFAGDREKALERLAQSDGDDPASAQADKGR